MSSDGAFLFHSSSECEGVSREVAGRENDPLQEPEVEPSHILEQRLRVAVDVPDRDRWRKEIYGGATRVVDRDGNALLEEECVQAFHGYVDLHVLRGRNRERDRFVSEQRAGGHQHLGRSDCQRTTQRTDD